jgi:hypothetical protein
VTPVSSITDNIILRREYDTMVQSVQLWLVFA